MEIVTETKVFVKQHWVLLLGGAIGLYVVFKYMGNSSSNSTNTTDQTTAALYAQSSQYNAASANAALQQQNLANQYDLANKSLEVQNAQGNNATQVAWLQAQGDAAMKTASASAQLISSMNAPAVQAISSSGQVTMAGLAHSASVANAATASQTAAVTAAANVINTAAAANALTASTRINADANIAMSNNQVASSALSNNAKIQQGYFGAVGTIANDFMHPSGQVNYPLPGQPSTSSNAGQPTQGQPTPSAGQVNTGGSWVDGILNNFGGNNSSNPGYTSSPVGWSPNTMSGTDVANIFGDAYYG